MERRLHPSALKNVPVDSKRPLREGQLQTLLAQAGSYPERLRLFVAMGSESSEQFERARQSEAARHSRSARTFRARISYTRLETAASTLADSVRSRALVSFDCVCREVPSAMAFPFAKCAAPISVLHSRRSSPCACTGVLDFRGSSDAASRTALHIRRVPRISHVSCGCIFVDAGSACRCGHGHPSEPVRGNFTYARMDATLGSSVHILAYANAAPQRSRSSSTAARTCSPYPR